MLLLKGFSVAISAADQWCIPATPRRNLANFDKILAERVAKYGKIFPESCPGDSTEFAEALRDPCRTRPNDNDAKTQLPAATTDDVTFAGCGFSAILESGRPPKMDQKRVKV